MFAPLALLGVVAATLNVPPTAIGQDSETVDLTEAIELGTVRRTHCASAVEVHWTSGMAGFEYTSVTRFNSQMNVDEWIAGFEDGRTTDVWRSYRGFVGTRTENIDWGDGPEESTTDEYDGRVSTTFAFAVDAKGNREFAIEPTTLWEATEIERTLADRDPVPLPGGSVEVGDSWQVPQNALPTPGDFQAGGTAKSWSCTATLREIGEVDGVTMAAIVFEGAGVRVFREESAAGDGSLSRDFTIKTSFEGEARFDIDAGRMLAFAWTGTVDLTGAEYASPVEGKATFTEEWAYTYGRVLPNDGAGAPEDEPYEGIEATPYGKPLADDHIVIARGNGSVTRLVVFDPTARKELATILTLSGSASIGNLAVSPDRKRVAFESSLNNLISIAESNVFLFNLETGDLDQLTPYWATGDGLAQPIETEQTCTLTGQIVWADDDPMVMRDRSDSFSGFIRVDHTACIATVNVDGTFELPGVPVGVPVLIEIKGQIPFAYANGNWRPALASYVGATIADMTLEAGERDLGVVRLHGSHMAIGHGAPGFVDDNTLLTQLSAWTTGHKITLEPRGYEEADLAKSLLYMTGGFAVARDGRLGMCHDSSGAGGVQGARFTKSNGSPIWYCEEHPAGFSSSSEGAWLVDNSGWVGTASESGSLGERYGAPALGFADPKSKAAHVAQSWPQLMGSWMVSVAVNKAGTVAWFVIHAPQGEEIVFGDVWEWDAVNDTLTQITTYHDVVAVGGWGR